MSWIIEQVIAQQAQDKFELLIATPTRVGMISYKWHKSNKELKTPPGWRVTEASETGQPVDIARNISLSRALIGGAAYTLFWDSDVLVPPDALEQLLATRVPIVSALLRSRGPPFQFLANTNGMSLPEAILQQPPGIVEVEELSMGFCLVDMRGIRRYARKIDHFQCFKNHDGVASFNYENAVKNNFLCPYCHGVLHCKFFDYRAGKTSKMAISEDYYFIRNMKEKTGLKSYVFTGVKGIHESTFSEVHCDKPELVSSLNSAADVR